MIRRGAKSSPTIKTPKVYTADGLLFKSSQLLKFYKELKALQEDGFIDNFSLPTIDKETKSKYKAKSCMVDDLTFDSLAEAKFYLHLKEEKEKGMITSFEMQPKFELQEGFRKNGKAIRAVHYVADFAVLYADGTEKIYDVKGLETDVFKLKLKMFEYKYRDKVLSCVCYQAKTNSWVEKQEIKQSKKKKKGE